MTDRTLDLNDETVVIPDRLLTTLHDEAVRLMTSSNPLIANWGRHLLEDWHTLELLADREKQRP